MFGMTISRAAGLCGGTVYGNTDGSEELSTIIVDSRKAAPGCLFAAFKGARTDGHDYINSVLAAGAACALAERVPEGCTGPIIVVKDVLQALEDLASAIRSGFDIPFVGITGSVGKTTAKEMVSAVLSERFRVHKNEGNLNNQIGVPITMSRMAPETELAVVEMGINHFGEMECLAKMVRPNVMLYTNIGHAHLEFLGDLDGVLKAKTEVLPFMPDDGVLILNGDDEKLRGLKTDKRIITYGMGPDCDVRAENIRIEVGSTEFDMICGGEKLHVSVSAYGRHMVYAALEGAAAGLCFGLSGEEIVRGITGYKTVGRRAAVIKAGDITIIDDCYNSNPDSLHSSLDSLAMLSGRRVAILGDMRELGDDAVGYHIELGKYAYEKGIDLIVSVGDLSRYFHEQAGERGVYYSCLTDLLPDLEKLIRPGDSVMIKASNSLHFGDATIRLQEIFGK